MSDLTSQVSEARKQGYDDNQILTYLATKRQDIAPKITEASKAGYSAKDIVDHLSAAPAQPARQQDAFEQAVNYRTGNNLIDAPLGVVQGAAKGAAEIGTTIGAATRYLTGRPQESAEEKDADTKPSGIGQGTGKFLEQAAEFAAPAGAVGRATKASGLLARSLAQAGTGAVVSAAQTQGNPTATALGAGLGAGGELAGAGIKALTSGKGGVSGALEASADKNYYKAINPTTRANKAITMETVAPGLRERGVMATSLPDLQQKAATAMEQHGSAIDDYMEQHGDEVVDHKAIVRKLNDIVDGLKIGSKIAPPDQPYANEILGLRDHIKELVAENPDAKITLSEVRKLRQAYDAGPAAKNAFALGPADQSKVKGLTDASNVLRGAVADGRPELKAANKEYSFWSNVDRVASATIERRVGQRTPLTEQIAGAGGMALGASHGLAPAVIVGKSLQGLAKLSKSTAWNSLSAQAKQQIATMVKGGNAPGALDFAKKALIQGAQTGNATLAQAQ